MKKVLLLCAVLGLLCVGCAKKIDTSSQEKFKASVEAVRDSLSDEKKVEFDKALVKVMTKDLGSMMTSALTSAMSGEDSATSVEKLSDEISKKLNGKTADQVIAESKK